MLRGIGNSTHRGLAGKVAEERKPGGKKKWLVGDNTLAPGSRVPRRVLMEFYSSGFLEEFIYDLPVYLSSFYLSNYLSIRTG